MAAGGRGEEIPRSARRCKRVRQQKTEDEREEPRVHRGAALPPQSPVSPSSYDHQSMTRPQDNLFWQRYKPLPPIGSTAGGPTTTLPSTVSICVRLPDGERVNTTISTSFPLSYLVAETLRTSHLDEEEDHRLAATDSWSLVTSEVPKRELNDLSLTLTQAGLTKSCTLHLVHR